ncbi:RnfH family protein [Paracidovorax avenae]|uniref:RnfH family protein n=1 Tax=Paracidovorax avenae TaxID=80867 RepID=UPI000D16965D|nr:RnfH family protein [Paracidovorax avenae]AVS70332.1 RnfH family protein [Paracidovorax avenae]
MDEAGAVAATGAGRVAVTIAWSPGPREVREAAMELPAGATVRDALAACGGPEDGSATCGIWGRPVALDRVLQDGDRVEWYRPLRVDPKKARRERFARQGARATGLFAARRPGAKAGY